MYLFAKHEGLQGFVLSNTACYSRVLPVIYVAWYLHQHNNACLLFACEAHYTAFLFWINLIWIHSTSLLNIYQGFIGKIENILVSFNNNIIILLFWNIMYYLNNLSIRINKSPSTIYNLSLMNYIICELFYYNTSKKRCIYIVMYNAWELYSTHIETLRAIAYYMHKVL